MSRLFSSPAPPSNPHDAVDEGMVLVHERAEGREVATHKAHLAAAGRLGDRAEAVEDRRGAARVGLPAPPVLEVAPAHHRVHAARVAAHAAEADDERERRDERVEPLVGGQRLLAHRPVLELVAVVDVGQPAELRHVAVREAAGDAHLDLLDPLRQLGHRVVVQHAAIDVVVDAQRVEQRQHEHRRAAQAALLRHLGPERRAHGVPLEQLAHRLVEVDQPAQRGDEDRVPVVVPVVDLVERRHLDALADRAHRGPAHVAEREPVGRLDHGAAVDVDRARDRVEVPLVAVGRVAEDVDAGRHGNANDQCAAPSLMSPRSTSSSSSATPQCASTRSRTAAMSAFMSA
jgi:hypothetical protein